EHYHRREAHARCAVGTARGPGGRDRAGVQGGAARRYRRNPQPDPGQLQPGQLIPTTQPRKPSAVSPTKLFPAAGNRNHAMNFYHIVVAALGCFILLVAAILLGREAYRRGQGQAQPMLDQLRTDYAYALEQQDERHREQLEEQRVDYQRQFRQLNNLLQETRSTATA